MSPRPRTVDDSTILEAAVKVLGRIGPERLTLAHVGEQAGLSAATLVQRFGSKRALMLAVLKHTTDGFHERSQAAANDTESPLEAVFSSASNRASALGGPDVLANLLSFYLSDLGDPEFRELATENSKRAVDGFKALLDRAVAEGELAESYVDTAQLAETIYSLVMGTLLTWTVTGEGNYPNRIRRELDVLLRPFRRGPRKANNHSHRDAERPLASRLANAPIGS
ncbi:MAG: TetR/AcrR family transcriptional regulator [Gemmatimonadaceae bacterium]